MKLLALSAVLAVTAGERQRAPVKGGERASVELVFAGHSSRAAVSLGVAAGPGQIQVDEAYLSLRDVRLREARRCDRPGGLLVAAGPIVAELVSGRAAGIDSPSAVRPDRYCRLEFMPRRSEGRSGAAPADLAGHTVLVQGRRDDGVRFVIRSRKREVVQLLALNPDGFSIAPGLQRLVLSVDLGRWLEGIDLASLVPGRGKNGIIRIDEGSHRELLRVFEGNLLAGISLCRGDRKQPRNPNLPASSRLATSATRRTGRCRRRRPRSWRRRPRRGSRRRRPPG